ncbi:hypothetical protein FQR65_LT14566 [Abscondita terminalis]|nr:hypothetical protein FQR65_LT14566 [Abscondita terminalis]
MDSIGAITASAFYGKRYQSLAIALDNISTNDNGTVDVIIIRPDVDPQTDEDDIDDDNLQIFQAKLNSSGDPDSNVPKSVNGATSEEAVLCEQPVVSNQAAEFEQPVAKQKKSSNNTEGISDEILSEAFQFLHQSAQLVETNPCAAFRHYVATELNKFDPTTLAYVKNAKSQIIFGADMGRYKAGQGGYYTNSYLGTSLETPPRAYISSFSETPQYHSMLPSQPPPN